MPRSRRLRGAVLLLLSAAFALPACQAQSPAPAGPVGYRVVHASATCGTAETSVRRIADSLRLKEITGQAQAELHGDTSHGTLLRLSMGEQASAGAVFAVSGVRPGATPGELVVEMQWSPPDAAQMHAAVMTRPCVIVQVPGGPYRSVRVLDPQGHTRATALLPEQR